MSPTRRPDRVALQHLYQRSRGYQGLLRALLFIPLISLAPLAHAQAGGAKQAIEQLENCDEKSSKQACVKILKRESAGDGRQAIKAQIRGGRIIWYEYNTKTGKVRRTN